MAHVNVVDRIVVESRLLEQPVVLACQDDHVVEVYVTDGAGLEAYVGHLELLEQRGSNNQAKFDVLLKAVGRRVREKPVSVQTLAWLSALHAAGLLR